MIIDPRNGFATVCDNKLKLISEIWETWEEVETETGKQFRPLGARIQVHFFDYTRQAMRVVNWFSTRSVESVLISAKIEWKEYASEMYTTLSTDFPTIRKQMENGQFVANSYDFYTTVLGRQHF